MARRHGPRRWALAAELSGIGRHVISRAVDYARERKQYGRPIGTFQAVQHRLAAAFASVVGAADVVAEAATSASPWTALVAKAAAGRAREEACTQAQQAYGAVGFTWEHEFHHALRRTYLLDRLFGDWRTLEREIGECLLREGRAPRGRGRPPRAGGPHRKEGNDVDGGPRSGRASTRRAGARRGRRRAHR